MEKSLPN